jgi:FkbM family methyltransferase
MGFYSQLSNPVARLGFALHQALGRAGAGEALQRPVRGLVGGRFSGPRMRLQLRGGTWDAWMAHPGHESETHAFIDAHFSNSPGVMFDVGACAGTFSLRYRNYFAAIHAFEASSENFKALSRNAQLNDGNYVPVNAAVAAVPGEVKLYLNAHDTNSLVGDGAHESVEAVTLDGYWETIGKPQVALIKIDVEGAEIDVLKGAEEVLGTRPTLIVEANDSAHEEAIRRVLEPRGYALEAVYDHRNMIFR